LRIDKKQIKNEAKEKIAALVPAHPRSMRAAILIKNTP
jgi:hypothetical protein